jgi:hypothetical protein
MSDGYAVRPTAMVSDMGLEGMWKVQEGARQNNKLNKNQKKKAGSFMPTFHDEDGVQYCAFDGKNDYLAVDKLFTEPESSFTVRAKFRTTSDKKNNWSLLDCDRSEYFNLSLNAGGRVIFSTAGHNDEDVKMINDMSSNQRGLNDGEWHTVTAIFNKGAKSMFIDGWLDASSLEKSALVKYNAVGTQDKKGKNVVRACFIGDGSEASDVDGARNGHHFDGDIASVQFYKGKLVIPSNPSFAYYPQVHRAEDGTETKSCASETDYGWPVAVGAHKQGKKSSAPQFGSDENLNYCAFNGVSDYLAVDKRKFDNAVGNFQIRTVFSTKFDGGNGQTGDNDNWALFDCDRSEFFHTSVDKQGRMKFSTAGMNGKKAVGVHDMRSNTKGLNDGEWHEVLFKYENGMKSIWIDGVQDKAQKDCSNEFLKGKKVNPGCREEIGNGKTTRFCLIGDGSEASEFDVANGRNKFYYSGKIAVIDYVENGAELPGTSPLDCHAPKCGEWDCNMWCKCYSEDHDDLYAKYNCDDDSGDACPCGWNKHGGYLLEE